MDWSIILAPLVGGFIGYITNDIAIRMLFRPHKVKHIFGHRIPFTPGLIPKEKGRIAEALGGVISKNLMNSEVLEKYLLSEEMILKIRSSAGIFLNTQKDNFETVAEFLAHYISEEEIQKIADSTNRGLTNQIQSKLTDPEVGKKIATIVVENVIGKMDNINPTEFLSGIALGLGGLGKAAATMIGGNIISKLFTMLKEPTERMLAKNINNMLQSNGEEIVSNMIGNETQKFMDTPVAKLLKGKDEQISQIINTIESIYRTIISNHLPQILKSVDISKIVRTRIDEMDVSETETLILQVMNKELKAIVWLGAMLGVIMGCITLLI